MQYVRKVVDLDTDKTEWIELGDHRPISEVATSFGIGPRQFRRLLVAMTLLAPEWDDMSKQHRHRLTPGAVASSFGIRHDNKGLHHDPERTPFDVLSPEGVEYIRHNLARAKAILERMPPPVAAAARELKAYEEKRLCPLNAEGRTRWLVQNYPTLTHAQIAEVVGITRQGVSKFAAVLERQISAARRLAEKSPGWVHAVHGVGRTSALPLAA
jgi:AraC-like DNA-binding protein